MSTTDTTTARPDRKCRRCGAVSGLVMLPYGPLDPVQWECTAGCPVPVLDLDAIEARANAATPGPWGVGNDTHIVRGLEVTGPGSFTCIQSVAEIDDWEDRNDWGHDDAIEVDQEDDAAFIAAARQDVPALIAEVRRLREQLAKPCGSCHPCTNWADETWRRANRKPPTVSAYDELLAEVTRLCTELAAADEQIAGMRAALDDADAEPR